MLMPHAFVLADSETKKTLQLKCQASNESDLDEAALACIALQLRCTHTSQKECGHIVRCNASFAHTECSYIFHQKLIYAKLSKQPSALWREHTSAIETSPLTLWRECDMTGADDDGASVLARVRVPVCLAVTLG